LLANFFGALASRGFSGRITGHVNVTSGDVGIGSQSFDKCACLGVANTGVEYDCEDCGRSVGKYVWTQSGDGAGSYPVIEIQSPSNEPIGALVVFDSALASNPTIQQQISSGELPTAEPFDFAELGAFGDLRALHLGILLEADEVLIADVLKFHDQAQRRLVLKTKDSSLTVIAYSEPMGKTDSAQNDFEMLTDNPNAPRPRVLAILPSSLSQLDLTKDEYSVDDWPRQILTWRTSRIATEIPEDDDLGRISRAAFSSSRKFCTQCGAKFLKPDQNFCQMCGTPAV